MGIAIRLTQTGGPNVLKAESLAEAQPGPGEVWIEQEAIRPRGRHRRRRRERCRWRACRLHSRADRQLCQRSHVVYDGIGKLTFAASLDCLRPRGLMVSFGASSGPPDPVAVGTLNAKCSLFLTRSGLGAHAALESGQSAGAILLKP